MGNNVCSIFFSSPPTKRHCRCQPATCRLRAAWQSTHYTWTRWGCSQRAENKLSYHTQLAREQVGHIQVDISEAARLCRPSVAQTLMGVSF